MSRTTPVCPYINPRSPEAFAWWKGRLQGLHEAKYIFRPGSRQYDELTREITRSEMEMAKSTLKLMQHVTSSILSKYSA